MYPLFKASFLHSEERVNWRIIRTEIKFLPSKSCCTSPYQLAATSDEQLLKYNVQI